MGRAEEDNVIGDNIKKFRKKKWLSQKQFAEMLGVNNSCVSNWENGLNNPPADKIVDICINLDVSASELLGLKLASEELSVEEKEVIKEYRKKKDMNHAVKVLLGIDEP